MFLNGSTSFQLLLEGADTGFGGGSSPVVGATSGTPAPSGPTSGATPISLSDTTPIMGDDGKPTTWGEYSKARYVPRAEHDQFTTNYKSQLREGLKVLAQRLRGQQQPRQGQAQPGQGQPRVDPYSRVRGMPIVDGDTLAALAENGFGQLVQTIQQQQQQLQQISGELKKVQGGVGAVQEREGQHAHDARLDQTIAALGHSPKDPFLRDLAEDVYRSFDWNPSKPQEFAETFKTRLDGMVKFVRAMDKAGLEERKNRKFAPTRAGGDGQPSGPVRQNPREIREDLKKHFFGQPSAT